MIDNVVYIIIIANVFLSKFHFGVILFFHHLADALDLCVYLLLQPLAVIQRTTGARPEIVLLRLAHPGYFVEKFFRGHICR